MNNPYKKPSKDWRVYETCLGLYYDFAKNLRGCYCSRKIVANDNLDDFVKDYIYEIFASKGTDDRYKDHCFFHSKKNNFLKSVT